MGPDAKKRRNQKKKQRQKQKKAEAKNEHSEGVDETHEQEVHDSDGSSDTKNEHAAVAAEADDACEASEDTPESITKTDLGDATENPQAITANQSSTIKMAPKGVVDVLAEPAAHESDFCEVHAPAEDIVLSEPNTKVENPSGPENAEQLTFDHAALEEGTKELSSGSELPEHAHGPASFQLESTLQAAEIQDESQLVENTDSEQLLVATNTDNSAKPLQHLTSATGVHVNSGLLSSLSSVDETEIPKSVGTDEGHVIGSEKLQDNSFSTDQPQAQASSRLPGPPDEQQVGYQAVLGQAMSVSNSAVLDETQMIPRLDTTEEANQEKTIPLKEQSQSLDEPDIKLTGQVSEFSFPAATPASSHSNSEEQRSTSSSPSKVTDDEVRETEVRLVSNQDAEASTKPITSEIKLTREREQPNTDVLLAKTSDHQSSSIAPDGSTTSCVQKESDTATHQPPQEQPSSMQSGIKSQSGSAGSPTDETKMDSDRASQQGSDLFQNNGSDELLPWEQHDENRSEPLLSSELETTSSRGRGTISQTDDLASALFAEGNDVRSGEEQLPWESADHVSDAPISPEDVSEEQHLADQGPSIDDVTTSHHEDLFSEKEASDEPLPWEEEENQEPERTPSAEHSVDTNEPAKKFSFLDQDDDLLDDDDSFLESDEEVNEKPATQPEKISLDENLEDLPTLPNSTITPEVSSNKYKPSQASSAVPSAVGFRPVAHITPREEPIPLNDGQLPKKTQNVLQPTFTSPVVPVVQPAFQQNFKANVKPLDTIHIKLDQEKKKSDAYDLPLELVPRKPKKAAHAKPFGASSTSLPSSNSSAVVSPIHPDAVPLRGSSIVSGNAPQPVQVSSPYSNKPVAPSTSYAPVNSYGPASLTSPQPLQNAPIPHSMPVSKPVANPYAPPQVPRPQGLHTSYTPSKVSQPLPPVTDASLHGRYAPANVSADVPRAQSSLQTYSAQARSRAFSNVSSGSIGSAGSSGRQVNASGSRYYNPEPLTNKPAGHTLVSPDMGPKVVPALKTIGLSNLGPSALSPNSQRRTHARSNSSVYAPAHSSKYAPTVQPQFHLAPHGGAGDYSVDPQIGQSVPPYVSKKGVNRANLVAETPTERPVDPQIAFHRQFPIFHWGQSSKIVYAIPPKIDPNNYLSSNAPGQAISVVGYDVVSKPSNLMKSFPGPLVKNKTKIKDVDKWITDACAEFSALSPLKDLCIWKILKLKLSSESTMKDISQALYDSDELLPFLSQPSPIKKGGFNSNKLDENSQLKVLAALQTGNHLLALDLALSQRDFALALILGSLLGKDKWSDVVDIYLHEEFQSSNENGGSFSVNLLALIFQVSVGNSRRVIKELSVNSSKELWAMQNWKMIISAILNNVNHQHENNSIKTQKLPLLCLEFLVEFGVFLCQRGMVMEGFTSFVIADVPLSVHEVIPGSGVRFQTVGSMNSSESYFLSEIYEYLHSLTDSKFSGFEHLLLQKVAHAAALTGYGLTSAASRYTDQLALSLKSLPKNSHISHTVSARLNFVSSKLTGTNGSWLGKPKLSQVWGQLDKSFNKFIGGDNEEIADKTSEKIFENFTPGSSRNGSKLDLSQQGTSFNPAASLNAGLVPNFQPKEKTLSTGPQIESDKARVNNNLNGFAAPSVPPTKSQVWSGQSPYDTRPTQPQSPWAATQNHYTPMAASNSSLNSPVQTLYKNSPVKAREPPDSAITPPPIFSALLRKDTKENTNVEDSNRPAFEPPLLPSNRSKTKKSQRPERINRDLLADLSNPPPPPVSGSNDPYDSRRGSIQSRGSVQSHLSTLSSPKQAPLSFAAPILNSSAGSEAVSYLPQGHVSQQDLGQSTDQSTLKNVQNDDQVNLDTLENYSHEPNLDDRAVFPLLNASQPEGSSSIGANDTQFNESLPRAPNELHRSGEPATVSTSDITEDIPVDAENPVPKDEDIPLSPAGENKLSEDAGDQFGIDTGEGALSKSQTLDSGSPAFEVVTNPYAPPINQKRARSNYNPYAPKNSAIETDENVTSQHQDVPQPAQKPPEEELDMFAYGGYNIRDTSVSGPSNDQSRNSGEIEMKESTEDTGVSENDEGKQRLQTDFENTSKTQVKSRFQPRDKIDFMEDRGDDLLSPHAIPVIKPASNPNFKAFTPIPALSSEEHYDDIVENESDDEEDDAEARRLAKEAEVRKAEAKENKEKHAKEEADKKQQGGSWFGWLRKENNEKKPIKAKLGHKNAFYYDEKLKRWVNKNSTEEEKQQVSTPPPPPPIIKKKLEGSPKVKPRSGSVAGGAAARTAGFVAPINPLTGEPLIATNEAGELKEAVRQSSPSVTPPVSLSGKKANGLDDLISLVNAPGSQPGTRRKKKGARGYVNVMNNM
ncbi:LAQU0S16e02828g1_1 [Lachancea quebecensis]|uniref:Protein transport protein sec16 n=1 Tax=Lachancea quebecensis TaxID=1654605 RepID=A0A0P1KWV6_9SACH|nr:LAQU0S16e02828g1_1 [Lachancea quebecensis]